MTLITPPQAVFFDWDGTLVDSYEVLESAHNHTREILGFGTLAEGEFASWFGKPRDMLYNALYPGKFDEAKAEFEAFYTEHHLNGIRILPGVESLLEAISGHGIPMGVVTNKKADFIKAEIHHLGWGHYFPTVIGAGMAEADKPSPAPLLLAIRESELKVPAGSIWMVGDTENDLLCASGAGAVSVLVAPPAEQAKVLVHAEADITFKNCVGLQEFLLHSLKKELKGNNI